MFPPAAAAVLAHLGEAYCCRQQWKDGRNQWIKGDDAPEVVFLDAKDFEPEPTPMEQLRLEKESATKNWLEYYHKNEELKKQLKEAQDKLTKLQETLKENVT